MSDFVFRCSACGSGYDTAPELARHQEDVHSPQVAEGDLEQIRRRALHGLSLELPNLELELSDVRIPATSAAFSQRVWRLRLLAAKAVSGSDRSMLERIAGELDRLSELARTFGGELESARDEGERVAKLCRWVLQSLEVTTP